MITCRQVTLFISLSSLPDDIQETLRRSWDCYGDAQVEFHSELGGNGAGETWETSCCQYALEDYYNDQVTTNNYKGSLEDFVKDYSLSLEKLLIDERVNLEGVESIMIDCSR